MMIINPYRYGGAASSLLTGLVSWWSMDETSGNRADSHGSNTLTDNNTVTYDTGKISNASQYTAANSEYLEITTNPFDFTQDYTVAGWFYRSATGLGTLVQCSSGLIANVYFICEMEATTDIKCYWGRVGNYTIVASSVSAPTGGWYFVEVSFIASSKTCRLAVNNSAQVTAIRPSDPSPSSPQFRFGWWNAGGGNRYLTGLLDEWGVWSRILTADERNSLWNGGSGIGYPG